MSSLQDKKTEKNKPGMGDTLHKHATNFMLSANNFFSNAKDEKKKQDAKSNPPPTIADAKKQRQKSASDKFKSFLEKSIKPVLSTLIAVFLSIEFIMYSEYFTDRHPMKGTDPDVCPYTPQNCRDGAQWEMPWKNFVTKDYENRKDWGFIKWMVYFITIVTAQTHAKFKFGLYELFKYSNQLWNPDSYVLNTLYIVFGGMVVRYLGTFLSGYGMIGTVVFAILNYDVFDNWKVYADEDYEANPLIIFLVRYLLKMLIIFGFFILPILIAINIPYTVLVYAYFFVFKILIKFFKNDREEYNFPKRFFEIMSFNKTVIMLMILATISTQAYEYLGEDYGMVFTGIMAGLGISFIYNIFMHSSFAGFKEVVKARAKNGARLMKSAAAGIKSTSKSGFQKAKGVFKPRTSSATPSKNPSSFSKS